MSREARRAAVRDSWSARLRRSVAWTVAIKLAAIALLFALFFSSGHRPDIDAASVSDRFLSR